MQKEVRGIVVDRGPVSTDVIVVRANGDVLAPQRGIRAGNDADHIAGRRIDRFFGIDDRAVHPLSARARLQCLHRRPQQLKPDGGCRVQKGRCRANVGRLEDRRSGLELFAQLRRNQVERRHENARRTLEASRDESTVDRRAGNVRAR